MGSNTSQLQLGRMECANWSHHCLLSWRPCIICM